MKTTIFGILSLCLLTGCNQTTPIENNLGEAETPAIESSENQDSENSSMIAEIVYAEDILNGQAMIQDISNSELSEIETTSLIYMREEEKLARDVYLTLYDTWGQQIFSNIAKSEQTHTDAVKTLLERYNITDPVINDVRGVFASPILQGLYDTLVTQGKKSLLDALIVGATIEDLDIKDLQDAAAEIDNEDILLVYANLERGSRNHMRSFTKNITRLGGSYTPEYISPEEYNSIIASDTEKGGGNGAGGGMGKGKNR